MATSKSTKKQAKSEPEMISLDMQANALFEIEKLVVSVFRKIVKEAYDVDTDMALEYTDNKTGDFGFFAMPVFSIVKAVKKNPAEITQELSKRFNEFCSKTKVLVSNYGSNEILLSELMHSKHLNSYVNVHVNEEFVANTVIKRMIAETRSYMKARMRNETVVIDYSSPNIAKPLSIAHMRSTILGNALYRIYHHLGYNVIRVNHLGDWGTQFGKLLLAYEKYGKEEELLKDPINYMYKLYVKFNDEAEKDITLDDKAREYFKRLESNDPQLIKTWELFKELSLEHFKRMYRIIDVDFDYYTGESYYAKRANETLALLKQKKLLIKDQDAMIIDLEEYKLGKVVVVKSNESTTYFLRDLTAAIHRLKDFNASRLLYVVGNEQSQYFAQLFKVLELLGFENKNFEHVNFGLITTPEGKMATRKGNIILMEEVLDKLMDMAKAKINEKNPQLLNKELVAKEIALSAIFFGDLVNDRVKDVVFDWNKMLDFEGDTGPYLLYTIVRANSILEKSGYSLNDIISHLGKRMHVGTDVEKKLVRKLFMLAYYLNDARASNKPHNLARYALDVAKIFNEFYHECKVIGESHDVMHSRLLLTKSTRNILIGCIHLLGFKSVDHM